MVALDRVLSREWAVSARIGPDYAAVSVFEPLVPVDPRLLVPVDVQALVVPAGSTSGGGRADVRSRMLDPAPEERLPAPFTPAPDLPAGVHLHWAVPDGLTQSRAPLAPDTDDGDLHLRQLPDRWLVCRLQPAVPKARRAVQAWIIESELGRATSLARWTPDAPSDGKTLAPGQFTAATGGDAGWAAVYDNVTNRLAFHDDLADLGSWTGQLCYVVIGWYAEPVADPLHVPTDPADFTALLEGFGWDVDLSSLAAAEDRTRAAQGNVAALSEQVGLVPPAVPPEVLRTASDLFTYGRAASYPPFAPETISLDDSIRNVIVAREPRVTSSLYHGTVYGVDTAGRGADVRPPGSAVSLTAGSTSVDVLSKVLAGTDDVQERMLNAFAYGTLRDYQSDDGIAAHDEAVHRHGFMASNDTTPGVVDRVRDPVVTAPAPRAFGGGSPVDALDVGVLGGKTMRVVFAADWRAAFDASADRTAATPGKPHPPTGPSNSPDAGFHDVVRPNPRWYQPSDPVLAIKGANRSQRHGYDGRFDPGERLACRLSGQPVRGYADLLTGSAVVDAIGTGVVPGECDELLREAALEDPFAIDHLVSLVPPGLGWRAAQSRARLRAETTLTYHLHGRDGDVAELLEASLKEGIEQSPVGVTYWQQPWVPLYVEWSATALTVDRADRWDLAEIDLEPVTPLAVLGERTLTGRSLLNGSASRALASAVDVFLAAETAADEAGAGIITDADAEDLAALALTAGQSDVLVASMAGINDVLLGFDRDVTFGEPGDDEPVVTPTSLPDLLRAGWLRLDRLRLVDAFGRVLDLDERLAALARADSVVSAAEPDVGSSLSGAPLVHLPPRFTCPARLRVRLLDADADPTAGGAAPEARIDESTPIDDRNPIAGWLLPDHADDALEFFDATGYPLGQVFHRGTRSIVTWEGAPGRPGPLGAGPTGELPGTVHLSRLAVALVQRDAIERASGLTLDESPLGALLRAVDTTLWTADPVGATGTAPVSVLVGRPIAVVRSRVGIELYDDSDDYHLAEADVAARRARFAAAADRAIRVRFGALARVDDGVLGYFLGDDYSVFHPVDAAVRELARKGGPQRGFLDGVEAAADYGRSLDAEPIVAPYVQGDADLVVRPGHDVTVTMLVLAGLGIDATCGVVPRKRLELNRSWVDAALQQIVPSFRVGPVLVDPTIIRMPRISALPEDPSGARRNTWTRRDTPITWRDDPILAATMEARLVDRPAVGHEGWARLAPSTEPPAAGS